MNLLAKTIVGSALFLVLFAVVIYMAIAFYGVHV